MPAITQRQTAPTPIKDSAAIPPRVPPLPDDLFERFPSLRTWQQAEDRWWTKTYVALQSMNTEVSDTISATREAGRTLRISFNEFTAEITEELEVVADELGAQAKRIVTVSAMAGVTGDIDVQGTPPGAPAINDYWIDTSDVTTPTTYRWSGAAWVEVTDPIAFAGVADERSARVTADGFLEGKYTLTVVAGNVVTGMNITSASGPGTNVSQVTFQADRFLIYSGSTNKTMFVADAIQDKVRIASVLTIDNATTSVYIKTTVGAGSYNSAGTPWFVDSTGRMSLGTGLTFDGSNLSVSGSVTASSGTIGGWTLSSTTLSRNNAILDSAGQLVLGTTNDVVYLSATDATYRIWIGNATAGSAAFRVTKAGVMTATGGDFIGAVTSSSGTIAGFTLNATGFTVGSGTSFVQIQSTGGTIQFGNGTNQVAVYSAQGLVITNTGGVGTLAAFLGTSGGNNLLTVYNNSSVAQLSFSGTTGNLVIVGSVTAASFAGAGSSLTSLNATNISSGTLDNARLPAAISVTTLDASNDISGNELNIVGTEVINNSLELVSLALILNPASGVKCDLKFDDHAGADSVFANYMKINANGATVYVPYRSTAP